jgi:sigma-E factor negative regulatory protein RseC
MIEEGGQVLSIDGDLAEIETQRRRACGQCAEQGGCGTSLVAQMLGDRPARLRVHNPIQARPGEQVIIGVEEGVFLRAAALLYGVPLLALMGGALIGQWLGLQIPVLGTELASLMSGLLGLIAALGWIRRRTRRAGRSSSFQAVILRRSRGEGVSVSLLQR